MIPVNDELPSGVRWTRHRTQFMAIALSVFIGIVMLGVIHFRFHLLWLLRERGLGLQQLMAIPDNTLPDVAVPTNWVQSRVGCMQFSLPPDLTASRLNPTEYERAVMFQHGPRSVIIGEPAQTMKTIKLLSSGALGDFIESERWTVPRLKLECYRANSCMYNWSMTPAEARRHNFIMGMCKIIRSENGLGEYVEYVLGADVEIIALFAKNRVVIDWESRKEAVGGYVHAMDSSEDNDWNWVRIFCRSISVSCETDVRRSGQE